MGPDLYPADQLMMSQEINIKKNRNLKDFLKKGKRDREMSPAFLIEKGGG